MAGITREKFIELLNKDLGLEYTACVQYTQHQGVLKGAMYQSIQKELIIHAQEELAHATILASQIDYLAAKQAEELNLYHLAQQLRTILAVEQEHAMDLEQALGE
ncbi:MAG: ferritin-like domain-containing protein [Candidatus Aureabacteria bacterium]|nr:ferritin-like domain-containing protein [Candidatus Auribacterota bacterium]